MIGIVLAAGHGTRVGGPKALLDYEGVPLARAHVDRLLEAGSCKVIAVVREEVARSIDFPDSVRVAISDADDPAGSLAVALAAIGDVDPKTLFMIAPVDVLPARVDSLRTLARHVSHNQLLAATPTFRKKGGHPVAILSSALDAMRELNAHTTLHETLENCGDLRSRVELDDEAVLSEINFPTDAIRWLGHISFH
jgi:CTP:molybdopterin cytidylyltransferase MocA